MTTPPKKSKKVKRQGIPKSVRFEVFKRDAFTCQYCGSKAPDVVLHVDHIEPLSKGGTNEIINLITSCVSCNSGKSDVRLDDCSAIEKQRKQIEDLNERRQQLEMIVEWRKGLADIDASYQQEACDIIREQTGFSLNENGKAKVKSWLRRYEPKVVYEAITEALRMYIRYDDDGRVTPESIEKAVAKVPAIAQYTKMGGMPEELKNGYYIAAMLFNRGIVKTYEKKDVAEWVAKHIRDGISFLEIKKIAARADDMDDFSQQFIACACDEIRRKKNGQDSQHSSQPHY